MNTPKELGYFFPAEWHKHQSTWLSYPHNENSWPDKINTIFPSYNLFIKELARNEKVNINILDNKMLQRVDSELKSIGANMSNIDFHMFKTNDAWCRDHGPAFLINPKEGKKAIIDWNYNAWGDKYPYDLDNKIPSLIAKTLNLPTFEPGIIMEGGSVDFNGKGTL
ncbi:MAG: agmatine deiminase family protein, partial [Bacteroidales bacterium]